jgi:ABC-type phosphate transport system substrate-binding protein
MKSFKTIGQALGLGAIATIGSFMAVGSAAYAAAPPPPPVGTSPKWFAGRIDQVRLAGSDTTYFAMSGIANLYNQSALPTFGCTIDTTSPPTKPEYSRYCNRDATDATKLATNNSSDVLDNFDHDEVTNATALGSGNGITQLCNMPAPSRTTDGLSEVNQLMQVDIARSSRVKGGSDCSDSVFLPFAKDGIVTETFPGAGPAVGVTNFDKATLQAIYCNDASLTTLGLTRISDWSQVPGATGSGTINLFGVQSSSGTFSTYSSYVGCPNGNINNGPVASLPASHQNLQENQAQQIDDVSVGECAAGDTACETDKDQRALYFTSIGRFNTSPFAGKAGPVSGAVTTADGTAATPTTIGLGSYHISRDLFNVYRPGTIRGSAAGFLNWVCDTTAAAHGQDQETGVSYNSEIAGVINQKNGFVRRSCGTTIAAVADPNS